jgi:hypothetical protein
LEGEQKTIQVRIREFVADHRWNMNIAATFRKADMLLAEAADRIDELEERIAIMSEDKYKTSEIRFP